MSETGELSVCVVIVLVVSLFMNIVTAHYLLRTQRSLSHLYDWALSAEQRIEELDAHQ